jgi:single-strand DNA-binding protein
MNSITLAGYAGHDPEVRYFESGSMVANFTLAVNRPTKEKETDWFYLEIWGKQAQVAADYVRKGSLLGIIGYFKLDRWKDRTTGEERSKPVVCVHRLELLGSRRDAAPGLVEPVAPEPAQAKPAQAEPADWGPPSDEEIPF